MLSPENKDLEPPAHLSPSSVLSFEQCPLKFRFSKIDGIPDLPGKEALLGNFVHSVLERFYSLDSTERTIASARALASSEWTSTWGEKLSNIVRSESELRALRWRAWFCIENVWQLEEPSSTSVGGIEVELDGLLGGVRVKGFIDRYTNDNGHIKISDYKTGKPPHPHWAGDKFEQLRIYAALLSQTELFPVSTLELLYLRDAVRLTEEVTQATIEHSVARIQRIKSEIDKRCVSRSFEPVKSRLCDYCSYKKICPAWN
jgi:putative RecB family exonuclease